MERKIIEDYFEQLKAALDNLVRDELIAAAQLIESTGDRKHAIYICGNGGSAAMASHMACDLGKGASMGFSRRYQAFALSDNISTLMAIANDISFEDVFSEQLKSCMRPGDLVIALSGSGNSPNILKAVDYANAHGANSLGITGYRDGKLRKHARFNINLNIDDMQMAEDLHLIVNHNIVNLLTHELRCVRN